MTSRERIEAVLSQKMPDRVPIFPKISFANVIACDDIGVTDYLYNAEKMAEATIRAYRRFGWDGIALHSTISWSGIVLGSEFTYPEDNVPLRKKPLIDEIDGEDTLEKIVIRDPYEVPITRTVIDAVRLVRQELGPDAYIMAWVDGVLNISSQICHLDDLLMSLLEDPDTCHAMFAKVQEQSKLYAKALVDAGADMIGHGHATASSSVISRNAYAEFALPYEKDLISYIHSLGAKGLTHICGSITNIVDLISTNGADVIDFDSVNDPVELMDKASNYVTFRGNIAPAFLATGTPEAIDAEVKRVMERTAGRPNFFLSSGCEVNLNVPPENLAAMVDAGKKYGVRG